MRRAGGSADGGPPEDWHESRAATPCISQNRFEVQAVRESVCTDSDPRFLPKRSPRPGGLCQGGTSQEEPNGLWPRRCCRHSGVQPRAVRSIAESDCSGGSTSNATAPTARRRTHLGSPAERDRSAHQLLAVLVQLAEVAALAYTLMVNLRRHARHPPRCDADVKPPHARDARQRRAGAGPIERAARGPWRADLTGYQGGASATDLTRPHQRGDAS